ncbi:MAG TPA: hypothetical protein EYG68_09890 [Leucothrix mucor]|nr:hypothetical protein [Leucothrix mucor]
MAWFSKKKTDLNTSIQQLSSSNLRKERIRLDNEERRLNKQVLNAQSKRQKLLNEYHGCRECSENHQAKLIARSLQNIDDEVRGLDLRHDALNKQQRVNNGLVVLKENESFVTRVSGNSQLNSMNIVELQTWVEQATEKGELSMERLEQMIGTMDDNFIASGSQQDSSLDDFMASLDNEMPATTVKSTAKSTRSDDFIDASLAKVDETISRMNQG